ncbi:MAG: mandelate racemase/muconate lactonizing enzyme family protein [Deltaproteobacteria bacterium]|nr:mandelate racemase/muconate lactonizing enzyme family protein [Deltaproteobacteria bacterium]
MRIIKIECLPITSYFKTAFTMRGDTKAGEDSVLIKIHTDEGITGIGDSGGTSTWYQGETQESIMALIKDHIGPRYLLGEDPRRIEHIMAGLDHWIRGNNQAKAVVDYALHDLAGKIYGVPVYNMIGGLISEKIPLAIVLSADEPQEVVRRALEAKEEGFYALKLKMGSGSEESDIAIVREVRAAAGDDIDIFIDPNGFWDYYQALRILRKMEKFNLAFVEQPLPWWDIDGLARLRSRVGVPVFADESAAELKDLIEIIRKDAADGLMIKVSKAGGILKSKRWISVAQGAGLRVYSGCMCGSGLEAAAILQVLASTAWLSNALAENLGPLHVHDCLNTVSKPIRNDVALNVPRYENGCLYPTEGPGLGIELNEKIIPDIITKGKKGFTIEQG